MVSFLEQSVNGLVFGVEVHHGRVVAKIQGIQWIAGTGDKKSQSVIHHFKGGGGTENQTTLRAKGEKIFQTKKLKKRTGPVTAQMSQVD